MKKIPTIVLRGRQGLDAPLKPSLFRCQFRIGTAGPKVHKPARGHSGSPASLGPQERASPADTEFTC